MWDSKYTDYKITNTPYKKDILKPLVNAFRNEGYVSDFIIRYWIGIIPISPLTVTTPNATKPRTLERIK